MTDRTIDAAVPPLDPDRQLALAYVPAARRGAIAALWALDLRLAAIVRAAREPALGAIRLAWWRDALVALDSRPPPDEPLLAQVAAMLLPLGIAGADLSSLADGWGTLLVPEEADEAALRIMAEARGAALFACAAQMLGARADDAVRGAGEGWALVDIAFGFADPALRTRALAAARAPLARATAARWPRRLRPIGMLAILAAQDAARGARTSHAPGRALRMLRHRIGGR